MNPDNRNTPYHKESAPCGTQNSYETAYNDAAMKLASLSPAETAIKSGATVAALGAGHAISLFFFRDNVTITHPDISVTFHDRNDDVPMWAKILILHYLVRAGGAPHSGAQITFKQLEGGMGYYTAFQRRSITPLLGLFGDAMDQFLTAGAAAGGVPAPVGDCALTFRAFPKVDVTFALWRGDDEFPPSGSVIFDSSVQDYLSTEDVAVLCNMIAVSIMKAHRSGA